jgi:hypothetical protein
VISDTGSDLSLLYAGYGATVTLAGITFIGNSLRDGDTDTTLILVTQTVHDGVFSQLQDTIFRLENSRFINNDVTYWIVAYNTNASSSAYSARVFSDDSSFAVYYVLPGENSHQAAESLSEVPLGREGIDNDSPWLQRVQRVCTSYVTALLPKATPEDVSYCKYFSVSGLSTYQYAAYSFVASLLLGFLPFFLPFSL